MKTKNMMVGILAAVLVIALWWTVLLKPTRAKASKVRAETEVEQSKLDPLQAQLTKAQRDAAHAAEFKAQLDSLQKAMPDSPALAAFLRDANAIASASGVSWTSVTHGPPTLGVAGVNSITLGIQVKGTYGQVIDYIARLAALQRLVVVDGVQLATAGESGTGTGAAAGSGASTGPFSGASELSAVISARMFESPEAAAAAGAATTGAGATTASTGNNVATPTAQSGALNNS
jgi:Tfp pilus assembly protein PilO